MQTTEPPEIGVTSFRLSAEVKKQNFIKWLFSEAAKSKKIISLFAVSTWFLPILLFLYGNLTRTMTAEQFDEILKTSEGIHYRGILSIIHTLACFMLAIATPRPYEESASSYITRKASDQIHIKVISLYGSLGLLYLVITFFTFGSPPFQIGMSPVELTAWKEVAKAWEATAGTWGSIFEIITATFIFFLYIELSNITVESKETTIVGASAEAKADKILQDPYSSRAQRHRVLFIWLALSLAVLSILSFYFSSPIGQASVRVVVACLSGVTLAMVVGRLGSLYINPGTATLFFLYLYAVIQPFAAFFPRATFLFIATSIALPLKVLLWLVFVWAFTSGKLWEYVQVIRHILEEDIEKQQKN